MTGARSTSGSFSSAGTGWPVWPPFPTGGAPIATGIDGRPVPVEQAGPVSGVRPSSLAQLVQPFGRRAATDGMS